MNRWTIRSKANGLLAISFIGILAAFPFQNTFWGGLLFAAFSAGTIGGLADSFAVGALFGDPLRIKWPRWMGTHIISKNRDRLVGELVDMVENELLTVDAIRGTLEEHHLGNVIVRYITENGGATNVHGISQKLASELLAKTDPEELAASLHAFLEGHADALQASDLLADIGDWTLRHGYDDRIVTYMIQPFIQLVKSEPFRKVIEQFASSAIRSYEGEKFRRRLVDYTAGLSAPSISLKVQDWLVAFLERLKEEDHPQRKRMKEVLTELIQRLREDEGLRERVEAGKLKLLNVLKEHFQLESFIQKRIASLQEEILNSQSDQDDSHITLRWLKDEVDRAIEVLQNSEPLQKSLDEGTKSMLLAWLEQKHAYIGRMVKAKLEAFTDEELIKLVKEKAGKDLQYIRLNGMIVGCLVGMALFLLTFWIGGK
ncbi:DUF445 domain-containing protein [Paenibacillus sp. GCM10027627]|uniref:DUF445 domain-containing protein n=1 Tax=unclassified Paenibacillus TaxID=185978 RepID=UPI003638F47E